MPCVASPPPDLRLVVVSNQSGIGRGLITADEARSVHERFIGLIAGEGISPGRYEVLSRTHPKPGAIAGSPVRECSSTLRRISRLDLGRSFMIGDKVSDVEAGERAGCSNGAAGVRHHRWRIDSRSRFRRVRAGAPRFDRSSSRWARDEADHRAAGIDRAGPGRRDARRVHLGGGAAHLAGSSRPDRGGQFPDARCPAARPTSPPGSSRSDAAALLVGVVGDDAAATEAARSRRRRSPSSRTD